MSAAADIRQYVVFKLGEEQYGFDVENVREIHNFEEVAKVHRAANHIEGVMNLRGKLLTVVNLRRRFQMEPAPSDLAQKIVVIEAPDAPVGFLVDEVVEVARIPDASLEKPPAYVTSGIEAEYVTNIAKHEDRLITIVNPVRILELSTDEESAPGGR
ncbi:MAG: purine-binding chemotaxis protein CheW [Candidatus Thermoplasmatota archaeon]|nr:purine-binding chemotaxis protein CheW [Candidatus Thermoplasmatota archaeon]